MRDAFSIYDMDFHYEEEECEFDGIIQDADGNIFYT